MASRTPRTPGRPVLSWRNGLLAAAAVVAVVAIVVVWTKPWDQPTELRLDQFTQHLEDGDVSTAVVQNDSSTVTGTLTDGTEYTVVFPSAYGEQLTRDLLRHDVEATADNQDSSALSDLLVGLIPTMLIVGVFLWFVIRMQGGGQATKFGRAKPRTASDTDPPVTFADVAGADEAVQELREVVDFLREPDRFRALGARVPRGVLLVGPPGTGKTLLARAVAGEADVPFFSISGSDFVEMFVGVGASRVRDLFKQAVAHAPSIVFIDEIDAVGRHRGTGVGGGHDEREQTLNQMLVQMDGFDPSAGVILMAATNRLDILDPALLRPGRFDRQILVDQPDRVGRLAILDVHARTKPFEPDVDLSVIARRTPGFTGADLSNVLNEAALLAARRSATSISRRTSVPRSNGCWPAPSAPAGSCRRRTGARSPTTRPATPWSATSCPTPTTCTRSRSSTVVWRWDTPFPPGRGPQPAHPRRTVRPIGRRTRWAGAEEAVFGEITTGAADDIDRATAMARAMVTEFGMSDKLGPRRFTRHDTEPFLGRDQLRGGGHSDELAAHIDEEISRLLDEAHDRARRIIEEHRWVLDDLAAALLERETLTNGDLADLLAPLAPPPTRSRD